MTTFVGPTTIDCPQNCPVPAGATLASVPTPRHNWGDVARCPHDGCGRSFLIVQAGAENAPAGVSEGDVPATPAPL